MILEVTGRNRLASWNRLFLKKVGERMMKQRWKLKFPALILVAVMSVINIGNGPFNASDPDCSARQRSEYWRVCLQRLHRPGVC
ncbi:MAG: hypothetical protein P4L49_10270 [Desulfosporosinus sp.]|nr:hypothetical protein [Desulfosporosinus sp.]